jgi:tritrans,polycis-undecaprenyl-diphosphate synthase [geranylgeranyl-diphosphate specific]
MSMRKNDVRKRVTLLGERAIETPFARNVLRQLRHNALITRVRKEIDRVRAVKMLQDIKQSPVPHHLAIIMDGNRRYAQYEGLPSSEGHKIGGAKLAEVVEWSHEVGIEGLTVFAFSTENFDRPPHEVNRLMNMFEQELRRLGADERIHEYQVRIRIIGQIDRLPESVAAAAEEVRQATKSYRKYYFNIAIGYGGREEIVSAVKQIAQEVKDGKIMPEDIGEHLLASYLYTADTPDPDLILRTSGEERISNFLLWQLAYSELYFSDVYWPALRKTDFLEMIQSYQHRQRRYGT